MSGSLTQDLGSSQLNLGAHLKGMPLECAKGEVGLGFEGYLCIKAFDIEFIPPISRKPLAAKFLKG
jgi:hypothetical protein